MAPEKSQMYDTATPIPTYDEAVAGTSRPAFEAEWTHADQRSSDHDAEGQSLLNPRPTNGSASTHSYPRRPGGYRPPTVETDDEDSQCETDSDSDSEADEVRREMQEMDIIDVEREANSRSRNLPSIWSKRIGRVLSLPQWRWTWRWRMPRMRIRLGEDDGARGAAEAEDAEGTDPPRPWWRRLPLGDGSTTMVIVARMLAIVLVLGFLYLIFLSDLFTSMARRMGTQMFDPESIRAHVQTMVDPTRIQAKVEQLTSYAHVAGSAGDYTLADGIKHDFVKYGLEEVAVDEFYVYLNYPKSGGRAVQILGDDGKPTWAAGLEEPDVGGETTGRQTAAFHAHSKSGDVRGPLIYANYGTPEDFLMLADNGIDTKGAIALVRLGDTRADMGSKVRAAEQAGFLGCIIYSDPADSGFRKGQTAPDGRWLPADAVQRGSVGLSSLMIGDPLSPGWESDKDLPRVTPKESPALVGIPSLPLAWKDAQPLLQVIKGFGKPVPKEWAGGVPDINEWWMGNLSSPIVRLKNEQEELHKKEVWNVYGQIAGIEQGYKSIIIGNHRDSLAFGAAGPHSGTAVMLEIVRIFGDLVARGWRPLRTIRFMSWDAAEFNLIGSTEFVEKNTEALRDDAFAYINLDQAVSGNRFHASGSPVFRKLILQVLNRVSDPHQNTTIRDLFDRRGGQLETLGAASDYAAFQDIAGTSSLDIRFEGEGYPRGSSYDNFDWMNRVGDPGFDYHAVLGQILALVTVELADRPIMPFDMTAYADSLGGWVDELQVWVDEMAKNGKEGNKQRLDLNVLRGAADEAAMAIRAFNQWELSWESSVVSASGWEPTSLGQKRCEYNTRMARFETDLLDLGPDGGIQNRTQFKHVVFGPQLWNAHEGSIFPAVRDAVEAGDWELAKLAAEKIANVIKTAAANLVQSSS